MSGHLFVFVARSLDCLARHLRAVGWWIDACFISEVVHKLTLLQARILQ